MTVQRLRDSGFSVRLKSGGVIGVKPLERLTDAQVAWIKSNKPALVAELQREAANDNVVNHAGAELRQCSECQHDKRSPVNPSGGLTWCHIRSDVTPMLPGTRFVVCVNFRSQL